MLTSGTWGRVLGGCSCSGVTFGDFGAKGRGWFQEAPSSFCDPFTWPLLNRYNWGRFDSWLAKGGKKCLHRFKLSLEYPWVVGYFAGVGFHFDSAVVWEEPLVQVLLFVCGSDADHHISGDAYEFFIHSQSFASVVTSFRASPKKGLLAKVEVEGALGGEWRCKLVLRAWIKNVAASYCCYSSVVWSSASRGRGMWFFFIVTFMSCYSCQRLKCVLFAPT